MTINSFEQRLLDGRVTRRELLALGGGFAGLLAFGASPATAWASRALPRGGVCGANPFTLGVASGEPLDTGVVLWTRLAPNPLFGGGMSEAAVTVRWEIATDDRFRRIVQRGDVEARSAMGHSVHVEVNGLEPSRHYWYRFIAGGETSPIGRTRTAPRRGTATDAMTFAFTSCQNYQAGFYTAHRHLAQEDVDLVVHLGDYIYEGGVGVNTPRQHNSAEITTLEQYRNRYALYKSDPDLQAAHAAAPWVVTWDDHEVDNNYAGDHEERGATRDAFLIRRAAAYQAYYEHMPLRTSSMPVGPSLQLYRRLMFGSLLQLDMLDTRQHRTPQPCGDSFILRCDGARDPAATILGAAQEQWLLDGLTSGAATWNVLANQVPFVPATRRVSPDGREWNGTGSPALSMDKWDGYAVQRQRVHAHLRDARIANPIIITGDVHVSWVADLPSNLDDMSSRPIGTEFVGTSISSAGNGAAVTPVGNGMLSDNPHLRFFNSQRGYSRCRVTPTAFTTEYRVVPYVERPDAPISTVAAFTVEAGRAGVQRS
ncbi:alkaline phosphatase D family protein [Gemmatimonas sp.]|jgi:alkaline phosphatase D|uniref:alkaline phosphatase D family protein n=1 Tax=Gemmatimonas sp. TaxID=1962908 RepID=UPI0037C00272